MFPASVMTLEMLKLDVKLVRRINIGWWKTMVELLEERPVVRITKSFTGMCSYIILWYRLPALD